MSSRLRFCLPALLLPLFGCGPGRNDFAPVCPTARLIPALADLTRYAGPGPAHDLTDLILQARVTAVAGKCQAGGDKSILPATVDVTISVQRGPAMQGERLMCRSSWPLPKATRFATRKCSRFTSYSRQTSIG